MWRPVILFNLVETFVSIMDALEAKPPQYEGITVPPEYMGVDPNPFIVSPDPTFNDSHLELLRRLARLREALRVLEMAISSAFACEFNPPAKSKVGPAHRLLTDEFCVLSREGSVPSLKRLEGWLKSHHVRPVAAVRRNIVLTTGLSKASTSNMKQPRECPLLLRSRILSPPVWRICTSSGPALPSGKF